MSNNMAFVFINTEMGSQLEVLTALKKIDDVKEAYFVHGIYDIVAKVQSDTMERVKETITWKIRRLDRVRSTLTMIVVEG